jgi:hypothetical protein
MRRWEQLATEGARSRALAMETVALRPSPCPVHPSRQSHLRPSWRLVLARAYIFFISFASELIVIILSDGQGRSMQIQKDRLI